MVQGRYKVNFAGNEKLCWLQASHFCKYLIFLKDFLQRLHDKMAIKHEDRQGVLDTLPAIGIKLHGSPLRNSQPWALREVREANKYIYLLRFLL